MKRRKQECHPCSTQAVGAVSVSKADDRSLASYIERLPKAHIAEKKAESGKPAGKRK